MSGRIVCGAGFIASMARPLPVPDSIAPRRMPSELSTTRGDIARAPQSREPILKAESRQIIFLRLRDGVAAGKRDPIRTNAGREIVDEVGQGAQLLAHWGRRLAWQPAQHPVRLAAQIMHYVAKAEKFELRRSPRAQVSQAIAAVDYHRSLSVECPFRVVQQTSAAADESRRE